MSASSTTLAPVGLNCSNKPFNYLRLPDTRATPKSTELFDLDTRYFLLPVTGEGALPGFAAAGAVLAEAAGTFTGRSKTL